MEKKKIIIGTFVALILIGAACAGTVYYYLFAPQFHPKKTVYIYIDRDDTADSIYNKVEQQGHPRSFTGFRWMAQYKKYSENIHTGRYAIRPGENVYHVFSRLYRGYQEPTNLTVGSVRTLDRLARSVGKQLMIDSAEIAGLMNDSAFQQKLGYNKETLPCLFIPETYQVYWDMSAEEFFERMQKRAPEVLEPGTLRQSHRHRNDPDGSLHPRLHRRGEDKQQSQKNQWWQGSTSTACTPHASASRPLPSNLPCRTSACGELRMPIWQ